MRPGISLFFLILILAGMVAAVSAAPVEVSINKTYVIEPAGTTPFNLWVGSILLGVFLVLLSFLKFRDGEEGLISVIAWIPIAFATFTSFAVDRITSTGYATDATGTPILIELHTVSSYPIIALVLLIMLVFAMGNTYRIAANQMTMKEKAGVPQKAW